jgi:hypothetical protein
MRLRTRLNLVVAALSAAFVIVLIAAEVQSTRTSVREEIEAANRVASQLLGRLAGVYSQVGGPDLVLQFLQQLGRVRANEVSLLSAAGEVLYRSPPAVYKAGREAPAWFSQLLSPQPVSYSFPLRGGVLLVVQAQPSRAVLDAWDDVSRLAAIAAAMFVILCSPSPSSRTVSNASNREISRFGCRRLPATKPMPSARHSIAWRRRCKTRCWRSVKRTTLRRGWRSGARCPRWPTSASKRNGA